MADKNSQALYNTMLKKYKHLLNEKLIFSHYFKRVYEKELQLKPNFENIFNDYLNRNDIGLLDINQKYEVVHSELQNAHMKWETFEKTKDESTDKLLAQNQEVISNIKDIKMEVYELNRKINSLSENKSGKISADVFAKFFDDKFKKLDNMKKKYKEQIDNLIKQITIATNKISKKDSNNELQFIDFHQLQIENKKYVKEVDEKNKHLLKLKMTIGKITQDKNNYKQKLTKELSDLDNHKKQIMADFEEKGKIDQMIEKQNKISAERDKETNMLHNKLSKGGTLEINHHVKEKTIEKELLHILANLKKKLEIEKIKRNEIHN